MVDPLSETAGLTDREFEAHLVGSVGLVEAAVRARLDTRGVDDAVQETLTRAWSARKTLRDPNRLNSWVYGIACRVCLEAQRQRRNRPLPLEEISEPAAPPPDDAGSEKRRAVREAVRILPVPLRETLTLKYAAGMSYATIAATLGVSVATVGARLTEARRTVEQHVRSEMSS